MQDRVAGIVSTAVAAEVLTVLVLVLVLLAVLFGPSDTNAAHLLVTLVLG